MGECSHENHIETVGVEHSGRHGVITCRDCGKQIGESIRFPDNTIISADHTDGIQEVIKSMLELLGDTAKHGGLEKRDYE